MLAHFTPINLGGGLFYVIALIRERESEDMLLTEQSKKQLLTELAENFEFVQIKIEQIKDSELESPINIKQISDLEKYASMQKNIISSMGVLESL